MREMLAEVRWAFLMSARVPSGPKPFACWAAGEVDGEGGDVMGISWNGAESEMDEPFRSTGRDALAMARMLDITGSSSMQMEAMVRTPSQPHPLYSRSFRVQSHLSLKHSSFGCPYHRDHGQEVGFFLCGRTRLARTPGSRRHHPCNPSPPISSSTRSRPDAKDQRLQPTSSQDGI